MIQRPVSLRGHIPVHRLRHLFNLQGGLCYYCLREAWHWEIETVEAFAARVGISWRQVIKYRMATREHLIKREDGGTNQVFNVVMACAWCNNQRDNRSVLDHVKFCRQHFGTIDLPDTIHLGNAMAPRRAGIITDCHGPEWE